MSTSQCETGWAWRIACAAAVSLLSFSSDAAYGQVVQPAVASGETDYQQVSTLVENLVSERLEAYEFGSGKHGGKSSCDCGGTCWDCWRPTIDITGRILVDQLWMGDLNGAVPQAIENMTGFRDARIGVAGNVTDNLRYKAEFEFAGTVVNYKDVYGEFCNVPLLGHVRLGNFREPLGLEHQTMQTNLTFMERSTPTKNFAPDRNIGLMVYNHLGAAERFSVYAGLFRGNFVGDQLIGTNVPGPAPSPVVNDDSNDWSTTARAAWAPVYSDCGNRLIHLAAGGSYRRTGQNSATYGNGDWGGYLGLGNRTSLLGIQLSPQQEFYVANAEAAAVYGPLSIQGEFYSAGTQDTAGIFTNGAYGQVSYFLTGESRPYDMNMKTFTRVYPNNNSWLPGAWEVAARYSFTDMQSIPALLGTGVTTTPPTVIGWQENIAAGVNWYITPYSRLMVNYVHSITKYTFLGRSEGDHVGARFQIDW